MESVESCESSESVREKSRLLPREPTIQSGRRTFTSNFRLLNLTNLGYFAYGGFLLWLMIGLALYFVRAYYCCIKERHTSFRCSNFATFRHSQELELAWLISLNISLALVLFFLWKIPGFIGYSVIFRKSTRLPMFWTLTMLKILEIIGFIIIIFLNTLTAIQIFLVVNFCLLGILLISITCALNFTEINSVKNSCSFVVHVFCKLTLIILFVQIFVIFIVGSIQFAFKVTGLDDIGRSANFITVFRKLREFPQCVFYYKMSAFFFHKLFIDNKNILSHYQYLKLKDYGAEKSPV